MDGANRLRLNLQKVQLIWLGWQQQLEKITTGDIRILSAQLHPEPSVRDLGVITDSRLTMADHVTTYICLQSRLLPIVSAAGSC